MVIPVRAGWRTAPSSEPSQTMSGTRPLQCAPSSAPDTSPPISAPLPPPPPAPHSPNLCLSPSLGDAKLPDLRLQHPAPCLHFKLLQVLPPSWSEPCHLGKAQAQPDNSPALRIYPCALPHHSPVLSTGTAPKVDGAKSHEATPGRQFGSCLFFCLTRD